jgi:hypothetical protein
MNQHIIKGIHAINVAGDSKYEGNPGWATHTMSTLDFLIALAVYEPNQRLIQKNGRSDTRDFRNMLRAQNRKEQWPSSTPADRLYLEVFDRWPRPRILKDQRFCR